MQSCAGTLGSERDGGLTLDERHVRNPAGDLDQQVTPHLRRSRTPALRSRPRQSCGVAATHSKEVVMKQIKVPQDVNGEYVGERISLKAGDYVANPVRAGHAVPGQDIGQNPVVSYRLEHESTRRATQGIATEAFEELQHLGLIVVKE